MREIKFKFWLVNVKEFMSMDDFYQCCVEGDYDFSETMLGREPYVIPIQCTGVRDANGIELFDGDIVEVDGDISQVRFDGGAFAVDVTGCDYDYTAVGWAEHCIEVVGNIYQNPELLN